MATCSYCGEWASDASKERIGQTWVYICGSNECGMELDRDAREAHDQAYQDELDDLNARYREGY